MQGNRLYFFLELDLLVELGAALGALGEEVEADALDMLVGLEVLGGIHLVALDLEFHQTEIVEAHLVALTEMTVDDLGELPHHGLDSSFSIRFARANLFNQLPRLDGLMVTRDGLVLAKRGERRLGLFLDSVFHT